MNYELSIIKQCLNYNNYNEINNVLDVKDLSKETQGLYRALASFHKEHPGLSLSVADLGNIYQGKDKEFVHNVLDTLSSLEVTQESVRTLATNLSKASLLRSLAMQAYEASEGSEKALEGVLNGFKRLSELDKQEQVDDGEFKCTTSDIEQILGESFLTPGLRWRLDSMNKSLGSLRKGNNGDVIARIETGKTTWVASEITFMAEQEACTGPIILFNNEQPNNDVMMRLYQASLGWTLEQVYSNPKEAKRLYLQKTQGKIFLPEFNGRYTAKDVERYCAKFQPSLIVFDAKDKILGFKDDRKDQELAAIAIWTRDLAKEYCPTIGIGQADGPGEGQKWLTTANMSNAKTDKPAESDWILGIGKIPDSGYEMLRFFYLSKNKLMGDKDTDPKKRHNKWETLILPEIARYQDL